jgi:hypothetical protein
MLECERDSGETDEGREAMSESLAAHGSFTPELLGRTASSGLVLVALEVFILKVRRCTQLPTYIDASRHRKIQTHICSEKRCSP